MRRYIKNTIEHLLFPHLCAGCGTDVLPDGSFICHSCRLHLPFTNFAHIPDNKTESIFYGRVKIAQALSLLYFTKGSIVQNILHQIKYRNGQDLAVYFGQLLGDSINASDRWTLPDAIIPLPLHKRKERLRGYNQAKLIAEGIGNALNVPVTSDAVKRILHSETQTKKHRQERWTNVERIFHVENPEKLEGKHILLVDDVLTTGASLEACAAAIYDGVNNVNISIATLAIATN